MLFISLHSYNHPTDCHGGLVLMAAIMNFGSHIGYICLVLFSYFSLSYQTLNMQSSRLVGDGAELLEYKIASQENILIITVKKILNHVIN